MKICPKCGGRTFYARQRCYMDIVVDGNNEFERNLHDNAEESIYESEKPYGPYTCTECLSEYDSLDELSDESSYKKVQFKDLNSEPIFFWCNAAGELNIPGASSDNRGDESDLPNKIYNTYTHYWKKTDNAGCRVATLNGKAGILLSWDYFDTEYNSEEAEKQAKLGAVSYGPDYCELDWYFTKHPLSKKSEASVFVPLERLKEDYGIIDRLEKLPMYRKKVAEVANETNKEHKNNAGDGLKERKCCKCNNTGNVQKSCNCQSCDQEPANKVKDAEYNIAGDTVNNADNNIYLARHTYWGDDEISFEIHGPLANKEEAIRERNSIIQDIMAEIREYDRDEEKAMLVSSYIKEDIDTSISISLRDRRIEVEPITLVKNIANK